MREGEFGGPTPEEIAGNPPKESEQTEPAQVSGDENQGVAKQRKDKRERSFDWLVEADEKRKESPVEEGAPKSEFEKTLVESLRDPEMAHEIALAIKPLEDFVVGEKDHIRTLFDEIEEIKTRAGKLERLSGEEENDFINRRSESYGEAYEKGAELGDRLWLLKDVLNWIESNENRLIDAFEKIRLAKLAGGNEPMKAGKDFFESYLSFILQSNRQVERSREVNRQARYRDTMREGSFLDKMLLRFREVEYSIERTSRDMETSSLGEWIKDKIDRRRKISRAETEARRILNSLGVEDADSLSYDKIMNESYLTPIEK